MRGTRLLTRAGATSARGNRPQTLTGDSLYDSLAHRLNDSTALEARYRRLTGSELVTAPYAWQRAARRRGRVGHRCHRAWNARRKIASCLAAIAMSSFNQRFADQLDVVVVDDGSTDGTWELLCTLDLDVRATFLRQRNAGQCRALSTALSVAKGDVVVSSDDDTILAPFTSKNSSGDRRS